MVSGAPAATIFDRTALVNLPSFGICKMSSPHVPCTPDPAPSFLIGSPTVRIGESPALDHLSTLPCTKGGSISFQLPGQFSVEVG